MNAKKSSIALILSAFLLTAVQLQASPFVAKDSIGTEKSTVNISPNKSTDLQDSLSLSRKKLPVKNTVFIDGKIFTQAEIDAWERKRTISTYKLLQKKLKLPKQDITVDENGKQRSLAEMREALVKIKMDAGNDKLRKVLKGKLRTSNFLVGLLKAASFGKRKLCVIEILVENGCTAEAMNRKYYEMMMDNGKKAERINRLGNPDHFVSSKIDDKTQEVIEITGGSPVPSQFFIVYGDTTGLIAKSDSTFPVEIAGLCRNKNGKIVGGVKHIMRDEGTGFRIRLQIEFPKATTKKMIRQHQEHLACEFTNWFNLVIDDDTM